MISGKPPFTASSIQALLVVIETQAVVVPAYMSPAAANIVEHLLAKLPADRLGSNGPADIETHSFFEGIDWAALLRKELPSPFVPPFSRNLAVGCCILQIVLQAMYYHGRNNVYFLRAGTPCLQANFDARMTQLPAEEGGTPPNESRLHTLEVDPFADFDFSVEFMREPESETSDGSAPEVAAAVDLRETQHI
jgi:hypothetical protein